MNGTRPATTVISCCYEEKKFHVLVGESEILHRIQEGILALEGFVRAHEISSRTSVEGHPAFTMCSPRKREATGSQGTPGVVRLNFGSDRMIWASDSPHSLSCEKCETIEKEILVWRFWLYIYSCWMVERMSRK